MKSIQTKLIALILGCLLLSSAVIGGAGVVNANRVVDEDSAKIMNLMCSEAAGRLDTVLACIEQSVGTLAVYALGQLDSVERLKTDSAYVGEYTRRLEQVAVMMADNTDGALAVYVRYNPRFTPPRSGLFWSRAYAGSSFERLEPTDFSRYRPSDVEHVGWYYIPVEAGEPTWIPPYHNKNINVNMISYVIPLYQDNETIGVVGMDIDFSLITKGVTDVRVYQSGYAFLADEEGNVMYHASLPTGVAMADTDRTLAPVAGELQKEGSGNRLFSYIWKDVRKRLAFRRLSNDMRLVVTAPTSEIDAAKNRLILQIIVAVLLISAAAILATVLLSRRITRPLRELTAAARKIAGGDLTISLDCRSKDEVGVLAESFRQTVAHLRQYISYINGLAYRDALTGVKNKTAYQSAVQAMEERMKLARPEFAVAVFDLNGLKRVNDTCGHDFGDLLIKSACRLICAAFRHSPVFRIGGDEFAVILEGGDYERYPELLDGFQQAILEHNRDGRTHSQISVARGVAVYDPETDLSFSSVFQRADTAMYENKAAMKQAENCSR